MIRYTTGLLAIKPKVWIDGEKLCARSALLGQILRLGISSSFLIADRSGRSVTVKQRCFWILSKTHVIPFARIEGIRYHYGSFTPTFHAKHGEASGLESFSVKLVYRENDDRWSDLIELHLFSFFGEGTVEVERTRRRHHGNYYGNYGVDLDGNQAEESLKFVDLLCDYAGTRLI